jgi:hypothetical protein
MSPRRSSTVEAAVPDPIPEQVPDQVRAAADLFEARQSGAEEPEGTWADRVWLPSDRERRPCCDGLEPDKLKDPQKLKSHCRTLHHVANRFDVEARVLRAELRRRRDLREEARAEARAMPAGVDSGLRRPARAPKRVAPGEEAASAEAMALHAKLVRLLAEKRADLKDLAGRTAELCDELRRQLDDEGQPIEMVLAESGAADLAGELKALVDDVHHLVITRDTIRRVL